MTNYLTPEGLEKLKKELDYLKNIKRKEIAERLRYTVSFGDLKENAAYDEAKEAQGFLEGRILELRGLISTAKLIEKNYTREVQIGSTVLLCSNNKKEEFQVVGFAEADVFNRKISYQSPLGKIILGKTKGDKVIIKTPKGEIEYKILEIK
jgi:transcription elongation factor GreA